MADEPELPRSQVRPRTVFVVCAVVLCVVALTYFLVEARLALGLTLASAVLVVALDRPVRLLQRLRFPRGLAITTVVLALTGIIVLLSFLLAPPARQQASALAEAWPGMVERIRESEAYDTVASMVDSQDGVLQGQERLGDIVSGAAAGLFNAVGALFAGVVGAITVLFVTLFGLIWGPGLVARTLEETLPAHRVTYTRILRKIYDSVGGYVNGLLFLASINSTCAAVFLLLVGVPYFLPLGLLSGLGSLVPLAGATVVGLVLVAVAAATTNSWIALATLVFVICYQQIENHVFGPMVYRRTVHLNPLVTLLAVVFFADIYGVVGVLMAVPLVAVAQILVRELLAARRERLGMRPAP